MMRFLLVLILIAGALVAAERIPALHDRLAWLPAIPGLSPPSGARTADAATDQGQAGGRGSGRRRFGADGPTPVLVSPVRTADVPVTAEVLGTVQATNMVTVRPQIDGKLVELAFKEGQEVKRGDVLARIDAATYQALYDQAVAKKAQDEAQLANAQVDLVRYQKLAESQYGSHQQADTQKAQVAQYVAQVAQDQASAANAKAMLDYATIRSPLDGRTGLRLLDQGNVVHASDATGIVTIAEIKPIAATFNLPQQWLRQVNAAAASGPLRLEAKDGETGSVLDTGVLAVVDNAVDQTTGTVKMKGSFPNADGQLWPGQFVNLRLYVGVERNVVVVPTSAVQRGPDGAYVYVVKDDRAVLTKVATGRQTESETVLTSGLAPPADVVTTGFTRLTDGAKVAMSANGEAAPQASTVAPAAGAADTPKAADGAGPDPVRRHRRDRTRDAAGQGAPPAPDRGGQN